MKRLLFILLLIVSCFSNAQNLVTNAGFESGLTNWITYTNGPSFITMQIDSTIAHTGSKSLRITINNDTAPQTGVVAEIIKTKKGGHYLFDCFIKTDSIVNGCADQYAIIYLNGQRLYGESGYNGLTSTTNGWKEENFRFYMPQGSDTLEMILALGASNGKAWFDDVSLTEITDSADHQFSVNIATPTGKTVNPFTSTNVGPTDPTVSNSNFTPQFNQLGMDFVRTHDYEGPCDMHVIFPDTSKSASDSTAYNFVLTDSVIKAIVNAGCTVYYRLGESGTINKALYNPPYNYEKWAQVALHIMEHFNNGWDSGYHYGIKYWEIWNEPDLGWNGTVNQFIKLYRLASTALKSADTSLHIGGPAIAGLTSTQFLYTFLDSVSKEKLPFDFFSYHYYHTFNPYDFVRFDGLATQILTNYGLGNTPRIVSEWSNYNYNPGNNYFCWRNDPYIAASSAAALTYYQNTNVFKLLRYRTDGTDLGMIDASGNYTFTGLTYYYMSLFRDVPNRLTATGSDTLGTSILAGQSLDGSIAGALIANNCSDEHGYKLAIKGIGPTSYEKYYVYRIDSNIISTAVDSGVVTSFNDTITASVKAPFVDFIVMENLAYTGIDNVFQSGNVSVYPNPFTDNITISYHFNNEDVQGISISDLLGRKVKTFNEQECKQAKQVQWNGCNDNGEPVAHGFYVAQIVTSKATYSVKLIHIK